MLPAAAQIALASAGQVGRRLATCLAPVWKPLLDLVYPPVCFACERHLEPGALGICPACHQALRKVHQGDKHFTAAALRLREAGGLAAFVVPWYLESTGPMCALLHHLMFGGMTCIGTMLGRELGHAVLRAGLSAVDGIIPVPLQRARKRERGYNQSELIARGICEVTGRSLWNDHLCRRCRIPSRTALTPEERLIIALDAFAVRRGARMKIRGSTVLLVDDFVASGVTLCGCGQALRRAGARTVIACAAALAPEWPQKGGFLDIRRGS